MTNKIRPHKIIDLTETTRVRHFTLAGHKHAARVAVWRAFRLVTSFGALLVLVMLAGCAASVDTPDPTPAPACTTAPEPLPCDATADTCACVAQHPEAFGGLKCCAYGAEYALIPQHEECQENNQ